MNIDNIVLLDKEHEQALIDIFASIKYPREFLKACKDNYNDIGKAQSETLLSLIDEKRLQFDISPEAFKGFLESEKFLKSDSINRDGTGVLTITNFKAFLNREGYSIKLNKINRKYEFDGFWEATNNKAALPENAPEIMRDKLQTELKKTDINHVMSLSALIAANNAYNPILDIIQAETWDGVDRVKELFTALRITRPIYQTAFRKWLYQCYCGLHNEIYNAFSLDTVLILQGEQGTGKTRLFEKLALKREYFGEGVSIDTTNKDSIINATSVWITELGEIGSTFKRDQDKLKAFISSAIDRFRPPYGRANMEYPRMTSFCGTTNDDEFLTDTTGNRRYMIISLEKGLVIDMDWLKKFNAKQLWAQIMAEVEKQRQEGARYESIFRLSRSQLNELAEFNENYLKPIAGEQEVRDILQELKLRKNDIKPITATEFIKQNPELKRYSSNQIGKVLQKLGLKQDRLRHYLLPVRTYDSIDGIELL